MLRDQHSTKSLNRDKYDINCVLKERFQEKFCDAVVVPNSVEEILK